MFEITCEQILKWINQAKLEAISPNCLLISKPDNPTINVCGTEVHITARPLIYTVFGIEIWIDESIPKNKVYLIDKNSFKKLGEIDNLSTENQTLANANLASQESLISVKRDSAESQNPPAIDERKKEADFV